MQQKELAVLVVILALSLGVRLADLNLPLEVWDEMTSFSVGLQFAYNIAQGNFDSAAWMISPHPPVSRYLYGIANSAYMYGKLGSGIFGLGMNEAMGQLLVRTMVPGRLLSVAAGVGAVLFTYLIGRELFRKRIAFLGALIFSLLPPIIGFSRIQQPDSFTVLFYLAAAYVFLRALKGEERCYWYAAILTGLAVATKFSNVILYPVFAGLYLLWFRRHTFSKALGTRLTLFVVIPPLLLLALWPRLWSSPVTNLLGALNEFSFVSTVPEYFLGHLVGTSPIDAAYYLVYFFVSTPILLFALLIPAFWALHKNPERRQLVFLSLWMVLHFAAFSLIADVKLSGVKNVMMLYAPFALLVAYGAWRVAEKITFRHSFVLISTLIALYLGLTAAAIHPYYIDYYNEAVGTRPAFENNWFKVGELGEGVGEAVLWLDQAAPGSTVNLSTVPNHVVPRQLSLRVVNQPYFQFEVRSGLVNGTFVECGNSYCLQAAAEETDYFIENAFVRRWYDTGLAGRLEQDGYTVIKTIEAGGQPLVWIWKKTGERT